MFWCPSVKKFGNFFFFNSDIYGSTRVNFILLQETNNFTSYLSEILEGDELLLLLDNFRSAFLIRNFDDRFKCDFFPNALQFSCNLSRTFRLSQLNHLFLHHMTNVLLFIRDQAIHRVRIQLYTSFSFHRVLNCKNI